MPDVGHNSFNSPQLRAFVERIEKLDEERRELGADIKDIFAEAKGAGFDVKIMRKLVALRRLDADRRKEEEEVLDLYLAALGMN
jgi:uncharacterized protein (UPF0335 family)